MDYQTIKLERNENICTLTMNNPKSMNALSGLTIHELSQAVSEIEADDMIRVVIITGTGKAFVAGADISYMAQLTPEEARTFSRETTEVYQQICDSKKVYIAAINGLALGGGCELALACDLRLASENAKFGLPEVSLGILPGGGGTQRLSRLIGPQKAKELIFTGDSILAQEALAIGLIVHMLPSEELVSYSYSLAERILKNAPIAVRYAKECIQQSQEMPLEAGIEYENTMFGLCFSTNDQKEGMVAFLEKRKANFKDK